jgi:hypothetical protein
MSQIENNLGNILIKHKDAYFKTVHYLTEYLTFTTDRDLAGRFYLLKAGDTTILNGDRIRINSGNRTLVINGEGETRMTDRDKIFHNNDTFIITNGTDATTPINYETPFYFISGRSDKIALHFHWGMEILNGASRNNIQPVLNCEKFDQHPSTLQFYLENVNQPQVGRSPPRPVVTAPRNVSGVSNDKIDSRRGFIILLLLIIVLVLAIMVSNHKY